MPNRLQNDDLFLQDLEKYRYDSSGRGAPAIQGPDTDLTFEDAIAQLGQSEDDTAAQLAGPPAASAAFSPAARPDVGAVLSEDERRALTQRFDPAPVAPVAPAPVAQPVQNADFAALDAENDAYNQRLYNLLYGE